MVKKMRKAIRENIDKIVEMYLKDPATGGRLQLTSYQRKFIREVFKREHRKFIFVASTRAGKTEITSITALFLALFYPRERIIVVAPTYKQARILFERIVMHLHDHPSLMAQVDREKSFTKEEVNFKNGSRIKCLSAGNPEGLLGYGASVLIVDEAGSIPDDVFKTRILRMIMGARGHPPIVILLGTPHRRNFFFEAWLDDEYYKMRVTWRDAVREGQMRYDEVMFAKKRMSELEFKVWYEAEFPEEEEDALFKWSWIDHARTKKLPPNFKDNITSVEMGIDVARFGIDRTVFTIVEKSPDFVNVKDIEWMDQSSVAEVVGKAKSLYLKYRPNVIKVDEIGIGAGVVDMLRDGGIPAVGFNAGAKARDNRRFANRKAEAMWQLRELFEQGKIKIPDLKMLVDDLIKIKYEFTATGQLRVIDPKDKSPDFADSLMMAVWQASVGIRGVGKVRIV